MNYLYQGDIPINIKFANSIAIDTEAMGLKNSRDRLCLVQICSGDDTSHLIQVGAEFGYSAPNLKSLLNSQQAQNYTIIIYSLIEKVFTRYGYRKFN